MASQCTKFELFGLTSFSDRQKSLDYRLLFSHTTYRDDFPVSEVVAVDGSASEIAAVGCPVFSVVLRLVSQYFDHTLDHKSSTDCPRCEKIGSRQATAAAATSSSW